MQADNHARRKTGSGRSSCGARALQKHARFASAVQFLAQPEPLRHTEARCSGDGPLVIRCSSSNKRSSSIGRFSEDSNRWPFPSLLSDSHPAMPFLLVLNVAAPLLRRLCFLATLCDIRRFCDYFGVSRSFDDTDGRDVLRYGRRGGYRGRG